MNPIDLVKNSTSPYDIHPDENNNDANKNIENQEDHLYEEVHDNQEQAGLYNHQNMYEQENYENISDSAFQNQVAEIEETHAGKHIFEVRSTKMNERYFSNNEEDEIKDCDLIIDDEEEQSSDKKLGKEKYGNAEDYEVVFYDNNYWKSNIMTEDVLNQLNLDTI
jgi:hypothetical protein